MKQVFAVFCALILIPSAHAHAWAGGPFSNNNSLQSGDDGIYEAVASMDNGMGMYRWAVRNNPGGATATASDVNTTAAQSGNVLFGGGSLGTASSNVWYFKGITYYGPAFGTVNSAMGVVSVIGNASTDGQLNGTNINNVFLGGVVSTAPAENIGYANSAFMAKITKKAPVRRFSGRGTISFLGLPDSVAETVTYTNTSADGETVTARTTTSTNGSDSAFQQQGAVREFRVMGTQVSTIVSP